MVAKIADHDDEVSCLYLLFLSANFFDRLKSTRGRLTRYIHPPHPCFTLKQRTQLILTVNLSYRHFRSSHPAVKVVDRTVLLAPSMLTDRLRNIRFPPLAN